MERAFLPCVLLLALAQPMPQSEPVDTPFYSLSFLKGIFENDSKKLNKADSHNLFELYGLLYELRNKRLIFTDALQTYVEAVETNRSTLEIDFRLNDVGESAAEVINTLARINEQYEGLGAKLSISNPAVDRLVRQYSNSHSRLLGDDILRSHRLNTRDVKVLHEIVDATQKNGQVLNQALDQLRLVIVAAHPYYLERHRLR